MDEKNINKGDNFSIPMDKDPLTPATYVETPEPANKKMNKVLFWPTFAIYELGAMLMFIGILFILSSTISTTDVFEASFTDKQITELEAEADPMETPALVPEWYFMSIFFLLSLMPTWLGLYVIGGGVVLYLLIVPFLDTGKSTKWKDRKVFIGIGWFLLILYIVLTILGALRGAGRL